MAGPSITGVGWDLGIQKRQASARIGQTGAAGTLGRLSRMTSHSCGVSSWGSQKLCFGGWYPVVLSSVGQQELLLRNLLSPWAHLCIQRWDRL